MLILECVEQKKKCKGPKWGGLLPISSFGSWHCSGDTKGGTVACTTGASASMTEDLSARAWACLGRPVVTSLLGCSITTESFLS